MQSAMTTRVITSGTFIVAHPSATLREALIDELEGRGHLVVPCADGLELVRVINRHLAGGCAPLDVLIGDASLPGYRPQEVMACLRWLGASFPIVLMGAEIEAPPSQRARRAGVREVLGIDATPARIADAAERLLAAKRAWEDAWKRTEVPLVDGLGSGRGAAWPAPEA
jgi:CheY-like chemotaxis protein